MNLNQLDLNLLLIFDAVMRTRSVTLAGERVGLSQSATSNCLQRLREAFGDPLFLRTPTGMQPSALALGMSDEISGVLERLRSVLERDDQFDPKTSSHTFRILVSDIAQITLLPDFVAMLRKEAPNVNLSNVALPMRETKKALADGELDLAVGFIPDLGPDYHRQSLDSEHWTCVVSKSHPTIGDSITRKQYFDAAHISYRPPAAIHASLDKLLESRFEGRAARRRVALSVPYFSGLVTAVAKTDLVLTAPSRLADSMTAMSAVKVLPLPFDLPAIDLNMQWHDQVHRDPANIWFRNVFAATYANRSADIK
ncbi:MAG: LysR family transcriptional regulator [Polaromonas sp.]|uniref:LysR family transcriptional regulator n=1 Tax=Polaromonas sp. TaxID=1869339 RepID=UPI0025F04994|nr:LysR family transcriptional regulator [Polaromonas sp.]MBI2726514.1 LysR family transcriptional regulator [Polaromonas sp.]